MYQAGKATTGSVSLLHSPAWQQARTTFKGHRKEGVYHRPGLCSGGADVPLEEVTGREPPAQTAQARQGHVC